MTHHIQIVGEAVGKLSDALKSRHTEIPWATIKAMRNVLVHFYFGVNRERVWGVVEDEVPALKSAILAILEELPPASGPSATKS